MTNLVDFKEAARYLRHNPNHFGHCVTVRCHDDDDDGDEDDTDDDNDDDGASLCIADQVMIDFYGVTKH